MTVSTVLVACGLAVLRGLGGALGILLSAGGRAALPNLAGWQVAVSPASVRLAILFAARVGVAFGRWPPRRAASLAPIEALRQESIRYFEARYSIRSILVMIPTILFPRWTTATLS